jgi:hypothetical protein
MSNCKPRAPVFFNSRNKIVGPLVGDSVLLWAVLEQMAKKKFLPVPGIELSKAKLSRYRPEQAHGDPVG